MSRARSRVALESGLRLDLNKLIADGHVCKATPCRRSAIVIKHVRSGKLIASGWVMADLTNPQAGWLRISLETLDQRIELASIPRHLGGRHWYFVCPVTGKRAIVLWMPPGSDRFASRHAWPGQVAYQSQFETKRDRAIRAAYKIRERIGGADSGYMYSPFPEKPKWMRWSTFTVQKFLCGEREFVAFLSLAGLKLEDVVSE